MLVIVHGLNQNSFAGSHAQQSDKDSNAMHYVVGCESSVLDIVCTVKTY